MTSLVVTKENFKQIRVEGIGSNFKVLNPEDGYRKDNRLWFGTCSECGDSVTNSSLTGKGWEHSVVVDTIGTTGKVYRSLDYCPKA